MFMSEDIKPLYMYDGGKAKLIKHYKDVIPQPEKTHKYVEPFFGGGALWTHYVNGNSGIYSHINDVNSELMSMLQAIKKDPQEFYSHVSLLLDEYFSLPFDGEDKTYRKQWYYKQRQKYWDDQNDALLFVLMRLGFNGIWQTCKSSHGLYGTPAGLLNHSSPEQIVKEEQLFGWAESLQNTIIHSGSYEEMDFDPQDSFIFCDPPYRDSFTTYGTGFSDEDQKQVCDWMIEKSQQGATVALTNRCVEGETFFEDILSPHGFKFHYIPVVYTAGRRKKTAEGFSAKPAIEFIAISQ